MKKILAAVVACVLMLPVLAQAKRPAPAAPVVPAIVQLSQIDLPNNTVTIVGSQQVTVQEARTVLKNIGGKQVAETVTVTVFKNVPVTTVLKLDEFKIVNLEGKDLGDKAWEKLAVNQLVVKCDAMPDAKILKLFAADVLLLVKK